MRYYPLLNVSFQEFYQFNFEILASTICILIATFVWFDICRSNYPLLKISSVGLCGGKLK